jgi:DNA-binding transcriptional ArsR family regulator
MNVETSLEHVAGLIGDPARAAMLVGLLGGRPLTAGELSMIAGVSAQNASGHLNKLRQANLISIKVQGRHRYYRLANPDVAHALESLAAISSRPRFIGRESPELSQIRISRTCYDHLAGRVATEITAALLREGCLKANDRDFAITSGGKFFLARLGIETAALQNQRRALARRCLDWTERKPHISGALGAALLLRFRELTWIAPIRNSRAVRITAAGQEQIAKQFGLKLDSFKS